MTTERLLKGGMGMDQIERITHMEKILNEALEAVEELNKALERYSAVWCGIEELKYYYNSHLWREDFDDDTRGKLPSDLKRGILSEDGIYNLLMDNDQLMESIRQVAKRTE